MFENQLNAHHSMRSCFYHNSTAYSSSCLFTFCPCIRNVSAEKTNENICIAIHWGQLFTHKGRSQCRSSVMFHVYSFLCSHSPSSKSLIIAAGEAFASDIKPSWHEWKLVFCSNSSDQRQSYCNDSLRHQLRACLPFLVTMFAWKVVSSNDKGHWAQRSSIISIQIKKLSSFACHYHHRCYDENEIIISITSNSILV